MRADGLFVAGALVVASCAPPPADEAQDSASTPRATPGATPAGTGEAPDEPPPWPWELAAAGEDVPASVPLSEIRPGGPPPDGIPAIDDPVFESVEAAGEWLEPRDPVSSPARRSSATGSASGSSACPCRWSPSRSTPIVGPTARCCHATPAVDRLTYQEAADALGIPTGPVMSRLHRARRLRKRLERRGYRFGVSL